MAHDNKKNNNRQKGYQKKHDKPRREEPESYFSKFAEEDNAAVAEAEARLQAELHQLREDVGEEISSESDVDGELLDHVNEDIDTLLVKLKKNDESIYEKEVKFFDQETLDKDIEKRKSRKSYSEHIEKEAAEQISENPLNTLLVSENLDEKDQWLLNYLSKQEWKKHDKVDGDDSESESEESVIAEFEALDDLKEDFNEENKEYTQREIESHNRRLETLRSKENRRALARERRKERKRLEREELEKEVNELRAKKQKIIEEKLREVAKIGGLKLADKALANDPVIKTLMAQLEEEWNSDNFDAAMDQAFDQEASDEELSDVAIALDDTNKDLLAEKTDELKQALEAYYKLDDEGDDTAPSQFKYIQKEPETFGLSLEELIFGDEKELDEKVPIKYYMPYHEGKQAPHKKDRKNDRKNGGRPNQRQPRTNTSGNQAKHRIHSRTSSGKLDENRIRAYSSK